MDSYAVGARCSKASAATSASTMVGAERKKEKKNRHLRDISYTVFISEQRSIFSFSSLRSSSRLL
jgi:hypothetical protein